MKVRYYDNNPNSLVFKLTVPTTHKKKRLVRSHSVQVMTVSLIFCKIAAQIRTINLICSLLLILFVILFIDTFSFLVRRSRK